MTVCSYRTVFRTEPAKVSRAWDAAAIAVILVLAVSFFWIAFPRAAEREAQDEAVEKQSVEMERTILEGAPSDLEGAPSELPIYLPPPPAVVTVEKSVSQPETLSPETSTREEVPDANEVVIQRSETSVKTQPSSQSSEQAVNQSQLPVPDSPSSSSDVSKTLVSSTQTIEVQPSVSPQVPVTRATVQDGRVRLRLLEKGEGPTMEIAWPESAKEREALYDVFVQCLAMRPALLVGGERLYGLEGTSGQTLRITPDRVSYFLRRPEGRMTEGERDVLTRIQKRHNLRGGTPVRLMNRSVDAAILGGLAETLGRDFDTARTIRARYRLSGRALLVRDISADGRTYAEEVVIATGMLRRC